MKCSICGKKIETTFLGKLVGTIVKDENGKRLAVCRECQRGKTKEELLALIHK